MNNLYNNLENYNENLTLHHDRIFYNPISSINQFVFCNSFLEGYHCVPIIQTESNGIFTLILDNERGGFKYQLYVRKLIGFKSLNIFKLNKNLEIEDILFKIESMSNYENTKITGIIVEGFIFINHCIQKISIEEFYNLIMNHLIFISVETYQEPNGIICGSLKSISLNL